MTNITGVRTTGNITQDRRVVDMSKQIALLDPNESPLVTYLKTARKGVRVVQNPKFQWLEDDLISGNTLLNGAISSAATTSVTVDDGSIFRVGDVLHVPSVGENMLVTAVSTNTLTVTRNYGTLSAAAASIADNAQVINLGPAMAENSSQRAALTTQEVNAYNFTQIFRTPFSLSGTEAASNLHGGRDRAYQRRKASLEHKRDIARALYFGQRKEDVTGATPRRTMGGLFSFLTQDVSFDSSTKPLTYRNFDTYVAKEAFDHGSQEKVLIAGPYLAGAINAWAAKQLVTDVEPSATFGLRVKNLITTYGDLKVFYDPLLDAAGYAGCGVILDPDNVRYVHLEGRDTKLNLNVQNNDVDGLVDEYLTECSLEVRLPSTHLLIKGCYVPTE